MHSRHTHRQTRPAADAVGRLSEGRALAVALGLVVLLVAIVWVLVAFLMT